MISKTKPANHTAAFDVVACYMEHDGKFILLQRNPDKPHGNTWGLPAGKVDQGETPLEAVVREIQEETGFIATPSELAALPSLWVQNNGTHFNYHSFRLRLQHVPTITLSQKEHRSYAWVTPAESIEMNLIHDLDDCNRLFFNL